MRGLRGWRLRVPRLSIGIVELVVGELVNLYKGGRTIDGA